MFLRFKYEEESFDIDTVINFIEKYRSKSLTQFYISEPDHEHDEYFNNTSILRVTGRQFRDKIVKNNQTYLVMLCDTEENCPDGLGALSLLDKLNPNPESLKFAYVDVSKNEVYLLSKVRSQEWYLTLLLTFFYTFNHIRENQELTSFSLVFQF